MTKRPPTPSAMVQCPHCWAWTADEDALHQHIAQTCPHAPERRAREEAAAADTPIWDAMMRQADPPLLNALGDGETTR